VARRWLRLWGVRSFYERQLKSVELLAQRPDRDVARMFCETSKAMKVEEITVRHLLS